MSKTYWQGFIDGQRSVAIKLGQYSKQFNMKQITREQANDIIGQARQGEFQRVVICYQGKWYDIRGMKDDEIQNAIIALVGKEKFDRGQVTIEVKL